MYWKPDRRTLVRQRTFDRLLDPPSTIRTQLATLCRVKAFDGLHQTNVSFRNQIKEREPEIRVVMSDLNDQPEVCFDHPRPSFLVALLNAGGKLDLLLRGQQRCLHYLSEVDLNARLKIVSHAPTSPQIGSEATAGFDSWLRLDNHLGSAVGTGSRGPLGSRLESLL